MARRRHGLAGRGRVHEDAVDADRLGDALDLLLAERGVADRQLRLDVVVGGAGDRDAAGLGERLHAVGDVHAVAVDVVAFDDHVAKIDADAELQPALERQGGVALGLLPLHLDRATQGIDDALELDQQAVAHGLDQPAAMAAIFGSNTSRRSA